MNQRSNLTYPTIRETTLYSIYLLRRGDSLVTDKEQHHFLPHLLHVKHRMIVCQLSCRVDLTLSSHLQKTARQICSHERLLWWRTRRRIISSSTRWKWNRVSIPQTADDMRLRTLPSVSAPETRET